MSYVSITHLICVIHFYFSIFLCFYFWKTFYMPRASFWRAMDPWRRPVSRETGCTHKRERVCMYIHTHFYQHHTFLRHTIHHQYIMYVCIRSKICSTYIGPLMCKISTHKYVSIYFCTARFQSALKFLLYQKSHIFFCKIWCHTSDTFSKSISNRFSNFFQKIVLHT